MSFEAYREDRREEIQDCLGSFDSQPVILAGTGISIRYFGGPSWEELLEILCNSCPAVEMPFEYFRQEQSLEEIGSELAGIYREWAWSSEEAEFPDEYYEGDVGLDIFLKDTVSQHLDGLTPQEWDEIANEHHAELEALQDIRPHAVITTNYDRFLEEIYPEFEPIVGYNVLKSSQARFGEIFKIHGCTSDPSSLVLTAADYERFRDEGGYITSKLMTLFLEHPVLIVGYSVGDENVRKILSEVDSIWKQQDLDHVDNIFYCEWNPDLDEESAPEKTVSIDLGEDRRMSIQKIEAQDFEWVFDAFQTDAALENVDVRLLRRLLANTYEIVRDEAPKKEIHFETLEVAAQNKDELATLIGVAPIDEDTPVVGPKINHPYTPTELVDELGLASPHELNNDVIGEIEDETGCDIWTTNNRYHVAFYDPEEDQVKHRRYSEEARELFQSHLQGDGVEPVGPFYEFPETA